MFDVKISEYAEKRFKRENVNVITNARVARIDKDKVVYRRKDASDPQHAEESIPYGLCLWSTGIGKWYNKFIVIIIIDICTYSYDALCAKLV